MNKYIFRISTVVILGFVTMSFVNNDSSELTKIGNNGIVEMPANVKEIIDNKCYGCHNSESKNKKGKKKLSFDTMNELSVYKQIGKYEGIHEVITEGEMPPEKFLAKYPNKALTAGEKKLLLEWANSVGKKLAQ